jgi:hypothetical protein
MNHLRQGILIAIFIICGTMSGFAQEAKGETGKWTFVGQLTNEEDTLWVFPTGMSTTGVPAPRTLGPRQKKQIIKTTIQRNLRRHWSRN